MTPRYPLVAPRRRQRTGTIALLVGLAAVATGVAGPAGAGGAAGADSVSSDTLSGPAGRAAVPPATSAAAPFTAGSLFDDGIRADRLSHASLALAIGVAVGLSSREPAAGVGVVVTLAIAKELIDDRFDRGDLAAGAVGAGFAWLIVGALTR